MTGLAGCTNTGVAVLCASSGHMQPSQLVNLRSDRFPGASVCLVARVHTVGFCAQPSSCVGPGCCIRISSAPTGLGSPVSCLSPLYRNREALLSGLTHGSVVCGAGSSSSQLAAAYLWDLRKPRRPASSLNFTPELPSSAAVLGAAAKPADGRAPAAAVPGSRAGKPGILCLSVHEDGALAAAGFSDGKVLTWDMRQVSVVVSSTCEGADCLRRV